ncbi:MAG: thioredoxin [Clostridia bacterium]|nr:thioredoxin [Clostridia bacterium]
MDFEITDKNFERVVLNNTQPVLLDFFALWCGPCMMMMPIIEDIADSDVGVYVCRADIDDLPEICEKYEVRSVPTLILFNEGKPMARMTGYHTEEEIFSFLHTYGF